MILATLAAAPFASANAALAEGFSGSVTGANGGTVTFSGSCSKGESSISCTRDSVVTGPNGTTATRKHEREITEGHVTTKVTTTGQGGRTVTKTREWSR
jgi:hypothetical protein